MSFLKRETPHNHKDYAGLLLSYYTIPRNNRELQHCLLHPSKAANYTIPRNNRELQPRNHNFFCQEIIPYQEIIGNYSGKYSDEGRSVIIPYQEIIGNYSVSCVHYAGP